MEIVVLFIMAVSILVGTQDKKDEKPAPAPTKVEQPAKVKP